jgi:hypothetical protein
LIVDAPWYVPNKVIQRDLQTPKFKEEICRTHPNELIVNLIELPDNRLL